MVVLVKAGLLLSFGFSLFVCSSADFCIADVGGKSLNSYIGP